MKLTIEDIAQLCGVSRSTVSRVINGDPNVAEQTRQHVLKVIQEHNYQPNATARNLAAGRTRILSLLIPTGVNTIFTDPFFALLIQGISTGCNAHDYAFLLWMPKPEDEEGYIQKILHNGLSDGVIVSSAFLTDPLLPTLAQSHLPYIIIGQNPAIPDCNYVDADNLGGARLATRHLIALGHRRIATVTGPLTMSVGLDRFHGYQAALEEHGLAHQPGLVTEGDFTEESGYQAMLRLLPLQPDAVFVASDTMAVGVQRALQQAKRSVPADISIVGFDDLPSAARSAPPLTTVRQPVHEVGQTAVDLLIDVIENPGAQPRQQILPTELIVRSSTAKKSEP